MTKLEQAFQASVCIEEMTDYGINILCVCGVNYFRQQGEDPVRFGSFCGVVIVKGCACEASGNFGNMLWQHRHLIAHFFRGMVSALKEDGSRLIDSLPMELGAEKLDGLWGTLASGGRALCVMDNGNSVQVRAEGRNSLETVLRLAFTPDKL